MLRAHHNRAVASPSRVPVEPTGARRAYLSARNIVEWVASAIALVVISPLFLVLAICVKLHTPGPAFYSQLRLGRNGRPFRIYKFRTMTHNCESVSGAIWARDNDPRITPLGRVLRDTHLDELPQLVNVLRGEMSLIGPRPERPELARQIEVAVPGFSQRLVVRPGLTGLAQMRLPADRELAHVAHKLQQDLIYIRNLGPLLDLRIALCTVLVFVESACSSANRILLGNAEPVNEPAIREAAAGDPSTIDNAIEESEKDPMLLAA